MTEEATDSPAGLADWTAKEEWRRRKAQHLFPTEESFTWFLRTYRPQLLEAGAIGLNAGRIFIHEQRVVPVVERILTSRAQRVYAPRKSPRKPADVGAQEFTA